jgi:hypothetical protein
LQNFTVPLVTKAGFFTVAVSVTTVPATTELLGAIEMVVVVGAADARSGAAASVNTRLTMDFFRNESILLVSPLLLRQLAVSHN